MLQAKADENEKMRNSTATAVKFAINVRLLFKLQAYGDQ